MKNFPIILFTIFENINSDHAFEIQGETTDNEGFVFIGLRNKPVFKEKPYFVGSWYGENSG